MIKGDAQTIARIIAVKHGVTIAEAELFVREFFNLLGDALRDEKLVKVKGLGTFKAVDTRERESIDVNTGERITIEGRSRITFTPDTVLRDLVNKPFAQFQTVVFGDDVDLSGIDDSKEAADVSMNDGNGADKPVESKEESAVTVVAEKINRHKEETEKLDVPPVSRTPDPDPDKETAHDEAASSEENGSVKPADDVEKSEPAAEEEPAHAIVDGEYGQDGEEADEEEHRKVSVAWLWMTLVVLAVGAGMFILGYYMGMNSHGEDNLFATESEDDSAVTAAVDTMETTDTVVKEKEVTMAELEENGLQDNAPEPEEVEAAVGGGTAVTAASPKEDNSDAVLSTARSMVRTGAYTIVGTSETITVAEGKTLKQISKFYFGDGMECYLQVHNNITEVKAGMKLRIPKLQLKKKK